MGVAAFARGNVIEKYQQNAKNAQNLCAMITLKYTANSVIKVIRRVPENIYKFDFDRSLSTNY